MKAKVINGFYSFEKNRIIEKHETIEVGEKRGRELIALGLIEEEPTAPEETAEEEPTAPEETAEEEPTAPEETVEKEPKTPEEKTGKKAKK